MSRIATARKQAKKLMGLLKLLSLPGRQKLVTELCPNGYWLAELLTDGRITGVDDFAIPLLGNAVETAEAILAREEADELAAKAAKSDPLMTMLDARFPNEPKYQAQYRADVISEFGNVGTPKWGRLGAARTLVNLLIGHRMLPFDEHEANGIYGALADGSTLHDPHGAAFRVVKV